ncbi:hypothetical protein B0O80DRAFT_461550 [Mortierella sp. GBAus27b]|nr:hypothetical protein B0O80DRAFT_461550 [Mortierella sp. GBAus27b]
MSNLRTLSSKDSCVDNRSESSFELLFEVKSDHVKIHLWTRIHAELISHMLASNNYKSGLGIDIYVQLRDGSTSDISDRFRGHDSVFDIMRHPSTHYVELSRPPGDLIQQSSILSRNDPFSQLKRIDIDLRMLIRDLSGVNALLSRIPNHTSVRLNDGWKMNTNIQVGSKSIDSLEQPTGGDSNGVKIHLDSSALMELMDELLVKSKDACEIDIHLCWNADKSDLDRLRDELTNAHVNGVKLLVDANGLTGDQSTRTQLDDVFDMLGHPSIDSVSIRKPPKHNFDPDDDFSNLKHMDINLSSIKEDIATLKFLVTKVTNHASLTFQGYVDDLLLVGLYHSIVEHKRCPIIFTFRKRRTPLSTTSHQSLSPHQDLSHHLSLISMQMDGLLLNGKAEDEAAVDILVKLERGAVELKHLKLAGSFEGRGDQFIRNVADVISRCELRGLEVNLSSTTTFKGGLRVLEVLEGDQWRHIRHLKIVVHMESSGTDAIKALTEWRDKVHGPAELDIFDIWFDYPRLSGECAAQLRSFVASTMIKELHLAVHMAPSDLESILSSMDVSRLEEIDLQTKGFSSVEMDPVLDCLTNAHNLQDMRLRNYQLTRKQYYRIKARGIRHYSY